MTHSIKDQISAVQKTREFISQKGFKAGFIDPKIIEQLNDAASTLAAIKMILSGDIGEEFDKFTMYSNRANGQDLVEFLKQKGLPIK